MSGMSSRFTQSGYTIPKYLVKVDGKPIIKHIIDLYPKNSEFIFILNSIHRETTDIVNLLDWYVENKKILTIPVHKKGPVYTVSQVFNYINDDEPVIINYCDFSMYWNYYDFEKFQNDSNCDGCVVSYKGFHPHMLGGDNYAFCKTNDYNEILEIREKQSFTDDKMSEHASTGTYYFKKGKYIKKYFTELMSRNIHINGEYYVSLVFNLMIQDKLLNLVYEVEHMLQWGTPLDLDMYLKWSEYYKKTLVGQQKMQLPDTVTLIPMAGSGRRFSSEGYKTSKPFISVNGKPMFSQAIKCLPQTDYNIFATLKEHNFVFNDKRKRDKHIIIDRVLPGQACTVEKMLSKINNKQSILISACDNGVFYDNDKLFDLINDVSNDIIVWSYRNNYTSYYNPNMYSWLDVNSDQYVERVRVKEYPYNNSLNEYAIVGTMFFRNKCIYLNSLKSLYRKNISTNNEFYIDNLLNESIELGYTVKNFEVENYICWGTPNDLKTYEYWQRFFSKVDWHPYEYSKDYFTNRLLEF